ncbi:hypothetical protein SAMN05421839_1209 [Halolactibacillus halophilus]|uniref:YviE n=1 Tax=Halolactibacillus halophilus TaxID=306540 RepID=A0A1I5QBE6_9BACI|nr:DUF6470 family protein [Halolactibacillus halophilus]GEM01718.1 hypothetical protein HHA03_12500 [Halolactibacillus halophilus]SFP43320.1 hypothetical protein SAMN05421839_1209 [Halolactibacillus halophilus]
MRLPQIRIDQQFARIGISMEDAKVQMSQPEADLSIKQPQADVNIETRPGRLSIDQSQAFHDLGQYPVKEAIRLEALEGKKLVAEGTRRRRREGDQLMKIENGGDPIKQQAKTRMPREYRPFNIGVIPSYNSVKINYEPADVNVDIQANKPVIQSQANPVQRQVTPANFDVYLDQQNYIDISFENVGPESQMNLDA